MEIFFEIRVISWPGISKMEEWLYLKGPDHLMLWLKMWLTQSYTILNQGFFFFYIKSWIYRNINYYWSKICDTIFNGGKGIYFERNVQHLLTVGRLVFFFYFSFSWLINLTPKSVYLNHYFQNLCGLQQGEHFEWEDRFIAEYPQICDGKEITQAPSGAM